MKRTALVILGLLALPALSGGTERIPNTASWEASRAKRHDAQELPRRGIVVPWARQYSVPPANLTTLKRYKANITKRDSHGNTKTISDYCEAGSNSEAEGIFKARYPNDSVSGVQESTATVKNGG